MSKAPSDRTERALEAGPVIAVVEDDDDLRELYARYLELNGFTVAQAENGLEAVALIKRLRPAKVVLDLLMPRLGGLEALKRIKAFDRSIQVVVVTGAEEPALYQQARAHGASAVLKKPVSPEALLTALSEPSGFPALSAVSPGVTPGDRASGRTPSRRVLVVDDEDDVRGLIADILIAQGYHVRAVADGADALRHVMEDPPHVVLLDIEMPRLGGVEALTAIRGLAPDAKVIMISGKATLNTAKLTLAFGAFDYVTKPFDLEHLAEVVQAAFLWTS